MKYLYPCTHKFAGTCASTLDRNRHTYENKYKLELYKTLSIKMSAINHVILDPFHNR